MWALIDVKYQPVISINCEHMVIMLIQNQFAVTLLIETCDCTSDVSKHNLHEAVLISPCWHDII